MRKSLALFAGVLVLVIVNWTLYARERLLAEGRVVLLELGPVDPRSLMQGDYMAVQFRIAADARRAGEGRDGRIVAKVDERGIGSFARRDDGSPLAGDEVALRYRVRDGRVKFATNAFFFQEGRGADYAGARYGELRVAPSGEVLLTGLRDKDLAHLGPK